MGDRFNWVAPLDPPRAHISAFKVNAKSFKVNVPFYFLVAGAALQPGIYNVQTDRREMYLNLCKSDIKPQSSLSSVEGRPAEAGQTFLRFRCYADRWVLKEVSLDGIVQQLTLGCLENDLARMRPTGQETVLAMSDPE